MTDNKPHSNELLAKLAQLANGGLQKLPLKVEHVPAENLGTNTAPKEVAVGTGVTNSKERDGRS